MFADDYPNDRVESMDCWKPCVAFDTGRIKDLVVHMIIGYLVRKRYTLSLMKGTELLSKDIAFIHRLVIAACK